MPLLPFAFEVALRSFCEVMPFGGGSHATLVRVLFPEIQADPNDGVGVAAGLGVALGTVGALQRALGLRLPIAIRGLRSGGPRVERSRSTGAIASFVAGCGVSGVTTWGLGAAIGALSGGASNPLGRAGHAPWPSTPVVTAIGLAVTGTLLATLGGLPARARPDAESGSSFLAWILGGFAHGMAAWLGASRVGAAMIVLAWMGLPLVRAAERAVAMTAPFWALAVAVSGSAAWAMGAGSFVLAVILGAIFGRIGLAALRASGERRIVAWGALWVWPLSIALFSYGRAL